MDASTDQFEANIGPAVSVRTEAPPTADAVFLPTDDAGTPGQLNREVLGQLGLPMRLPTAADLKKGYHVDPSAKGLLCYVVTVTDIPAPDALRINLVRALSDRSLASVRTIWIPLMGTGAGQIAFSKSFEIIVNALLSSTIIADGEATAIISLPQHIPPDMREGLLRAIQIASTEARDARSTFESTDKGPYEFASSDAVIGVLRYASSLAGLHRARRYRLSTTLLFFALAESQSASAAAAVRSDLACEFFSSAVRLLAAERYPAAWRAYFGTENHLPSSEQGQNLLQPTDNVATVLRNAHMLAGSAKRSIEIDHVVTALLGLEDARLRRVMAQMEITPDELLAEYRNARLGTIATKFNNDLATSEDKLGYGSYASAIYDFLTHAETPPPLSVSIQAPWGGGKSSLMTLVRDKLDPPEIREKHKPSIAGITGTPRLLLGSVVRLLDRKENFSIRADHIQPSEAGEQPKRLWTIWFNAWKYDTTEQIWAGLVDAIVSQVADRLPSLEREKFLLKLQLSRIDDGVIRKRIYDRVVTIWWAKIRSWVLVGGTTILGLLGLGVVEPALPGTVRAAISLQSANGYAGAIATQIILSVYIVGSYFKSRRETHREPATYSLAEYIRVPDYEKTVGQIHQIHSDLRRVLGVVPKLPGESDHAPIVVFIDDLDRCSPGKVAGVVEGVSMLLASDTYRCMFVIGMDPQMVAAALEKAHEDVRKQLPRYERAVPLGWRFMDKFIQLPFTIPPTSGRQFESYVDWLAGMPSDRTIDQGQTATTRTRQAPASPHVEPRPDRPNVGQRPEASGDEDMSRGDKVSREASAAFIESRDVGAIIRKLAAYSVGNPREMKRMVNLARFYLALRSARRQRNERWRAPDLDQYARWIAMTLRWPDMLRWLQWGADEAHWASGEQGTDLTARRLRALETYASTCETPDKWQTALREELNVPVDSESDWARDPKIFEFFKAESKMPAGTQLSDAAVCGFW